MTSFFQQRCGQHGEFDTIHTMHRNGIAEFQQKRYKSARRIFVRVLQELRDLHIRHIVRSNNEDDWNNDEGDDDDDEHHDDVMCIDESINPKNLLVSNPRPKMDIRVPNTVRSCSSSSYCGSNPVDSSSTESLSPCQGGENLDGNQDQPASHDNVNATSINATASVTNHQSCAYYSRPIGCCEDMFFTGAIHLPSSMSSPVEDVSNNIRNSSEDDDDDVVDDDDDDDIVLATEYASAIVLYNIGLTLHMSGEEGGSSIHHQNADFFYRQSYRLLQVQLDEELEDEEDEDSYISDEYQIRLRAALCLNMTYLNNVAFHNELFARNMLGALSDELSCWMMWDHRMNSSSTDQESYTDYEHSNPDLAFFHQCLLLANLISNFHAASAA